MTEAKVFVLSGSQVGEEVSFAEDLIIGRSEKAGLPLVDSTVSRSHARVCLRGGRWLLVDLKSSNGTSMAGKPVTRVELDSGAEFNVGDVSLRFVAQVEMAEAGADEQLSDSGWSDEIDLEDDDDDEPVVTTPTPTPVDSTSRKPSPAPVKKPILAGSGTMRKLGNPDGGGQGSLSGGEGGFMTDDMKQWSGMSKLVGFLIALLICAGVAYGCFILAQGF